MLPLQGARFWFPVGELRSHMLCSRTKKKIIQIQMDRGPEKTFCHWSHTDSQTHERTFNISITQGSVNHNNHLTPVKWVWSKTLQITNVGKDMEKREPCYTVGGIAIWCSHYRNNMKFPQNTKNRASVWSSNSTPGYISPQKQKH